MTIKEYINSSKNIDNFIVVKRYSDDSYFCSFNAQDIYDISESIQESDIKGTYTDYEITIDDYATIIFI